MSLSVAPRHAAALTRGMIGLVAVVTVGCSGPVGSDATASPSSTTRPESTTTASATTAPVSAFAEVVAEMEPLLADAAADVDTCIESDSPRACQDASAMFGRHAQTLHDKLADRHRPSSDTYVGVPPSEIKTLLQETETLADRAAIMSAEYDAAECPDQLLDCTRERLWAGLAVTELMRKLPAWDAHR